MKKETLGARLRRSQDEMRTQQYKLSEQSQGVGKSSPTKPDAKELRLVTQVLENAKARLARCIKLGVLRPEIVLGSDVEGPGSSSRATRCIELLLALEH